MTRSQAARVDAGVRKNAPRENYATAQNIRINNDLGDTCFGYVKVDVPTGETVRYAVLEVTVVSGPANALLFADSCSNDWTETNLTWRNQPSTVRSGRSTSIGAGGRVRIPVTVTPGTVQSWRIRTNATTDVVIRSQEAGTAVGPVLVINPTEDPAPVPTDPTPVPDEPDPDVPTEPTPDPEPEPTPDPTPSSSHPPKVPISLKRVGMSAPANLWDQRVAQVDECGITARRIFADLTSDGGSQWNLITQAVADGMMPVISYKVPNQQTLASGGYDSWLTALNNRIVNLGVPVTVTYWHEPRGDFSPVSLFHQGSQKFLDKITAPNAAVGPILNGWLLDNRVAEFTSYTTPALLRQWDFVAVDSYQSGDPTNPGDRMPARAIPLLVQWLRQQGFEQMPIGLGEYNGFSAASIREAGEVILSTPQMWFGLVWNSQGDSYAPLEGDRITAFKQTKSDPRALDHC